jgi:DNA polymerase-3 subunit gamma/tau
VAYQSLYRRYRPRRFAEVRGQQHVSQALRNAVREGRYGHAYLFSGPRGTGKTSTARILAKALNCANLQDGEPCLECESCKAIEAGTSYDLHELDAASNNGVEAMRDLIAKTALGTPGRTKVYILDEAHMLSPAAANALLKTLEEPPGHVVFVLATTEPHKVIPTIRSRTQHFDFHLLAADDAEALVRAIAGDAGLEVSDDAVDYVLREGGGSARDTLSALDQVVAAGGVVDRGNDVDELVEALADRDTGRALVAVTEMTAAGRDPRVLGERLLGRLRDVFLAAMKAGLDHLVDTDQARALELAARFEPRQITRALEVLGTALVDMHQAPDQRICLEVALVRLTNPDADASTAALADRLDRLERVVARLTPGTGGAPAPSTAPKSASNDRSPDSPAAGARLALGGAAARRTVEAPPEPAPDQAPPTRPATASATTLVTEPLPSRDQLTLAWGDKVLPSLRAPKAMYSSGRFVSVEPDVAVFALPNRHHRDRCEQHRPDVEAALAAHFGRPVPLRLVIESEIEDAARQASPIPTAAEDAGGDEMIDPAELVDAPAPSAAPHLDLIAEAFPGSEIVEDA